MKKLKCESCGGNIEIDELAEFATCPFCKTKYKLNETKNVYIKLDDNTKELLEHSMHNFGKISKVALIPFAAVFIMILIVTFIIIFNVSKHSKPTNNHLTNNETETQKEIENTINNVKKTISKTAFNSKFEPYSGTQSKFFIESLLDNAVTNNKTNKDLLVTVIYKDKTTTDPDEIINIKHSLKDRVKYEIKLNYDEDNYVNTITIEDL